jgi:transposase-like protein
LKHHAISRILIELGGDIMKATEFNKLMDNFKRTNRSQRYKLRKYLDYKATGDKGTDLIEESFKGDRLCPHCSCNRLYLWGKSNDLQRYRCRECKHTFNALTHTPLSGLRHKEKWLDYEQAMTQGLSIRKAAMICSITKNTSFKWRHRFLRVPATHQAEQMTGIVEADETFFLESLKGQRNIGRSPRKRGGKASQRGTSKEHTAVLVVRDRHGETADFVLQGVSADQIEPVLKPLLNKDLILCTDGARAYISIAKHAGVMHKPVNIAAGIRVVDGVYHIQNVNAYDSRLKQWMVKFHGVATRYLENYLGWHRMLDRLGKNFIPTSCLLETLGRKRQFQQLTTT